MALSVRRPRGSLGGLASLRAASPSVILTPGTATLRSLLCHLPAFRVFRGLPCFCLYSCLLRVLSWATLQPLPDLPARQSPDLRSTATRLSSISVSNAKTEAVELIKKLPDDATLEDIQHHLYVLEKIKQGQQRLVSEGGISHAVMEQDMARWTSP